MVGVIASCIVSGCISSDDDSSGGTTINSLSVTGTSANVDDYVPINPNLSNGTFSVGWSVSSSDPYHAELYISEDASLSTSTDRRFFQQNCGSSSLYNCSSSASFSCQYTTQNMISCNNDSGTNLTTFLDTIPKDAYVIIEACNALHDSCQTSSVKTQLQ